ncbi:MAG: aminoacyl-tRNA hydrolase [Nocardioidaceae bacterium]|nr:aminoacyl-tRNA hydrolase [Nocardioidaceae bacterium]
MPYDGWIVVGLGNPGASYANTRHNVGYLVADELARRMGGSWKAQKSGRALAVEGRLAGVPGVRAVLGRGRCYMNESGGPISSLLAFFKASPEQLVVIHDELDLPYGGLRVKYGGGDNGHNGLKSIRQALGTGEYYRVRFGIGRPPGRQDPVDFVLTPFSSAEKRELDLYVQRAADAVESLATGGLESAQNLYH